MNHEQKPSKAGQARITGAKSKGPKTAAGKRTSRKNALKTGLHAQSIESFPEREQERYHQLIRLYLDDYIPEDSFEVDLIHQLALNRIRYFRFQTLEARAREMAGPFEALEKLHRVLDALERAFLRLTNTLDTRRRKKPPINTRITVRWIDPETGRTWSTKDLKKELKTTQPLLAAPARTSATAPQSATTLPGQCLLHDGNMDVRPRNGPLTR